MRVPWVCEPSAGVGVGWDDRRSTGTREGLVRSTARASASCKFQAWCKPSLLSPGLTPKSAIIVKHQQQQHHHQQKQRQQQQEEQKQQRKAGVAKDQSRSKSKGKAQ